MSWFRDTPKVRKMLAKERAALALADHRYHAQTRALDGRGTKGACECREWRGWDFGHPEHLADMLDRAGLLADGAPPKTPTTRVLAERADRRTT